MINRDDIRDQFSPLLDGELSPEERAKIETALSEDAELLRELDSLKRIDDLYRALPQVAAPPELDAGIGNSLRPKSGSIVSISPGQNRSRRLWPGLAAAAVLLIGVGVIMFGLDRSTAPTRLASDRNFGAQREAALRQEMQAAPMDAPVQSAASAESAAAEEAASPPLTDISGEEVSQSLMESNSIGDSAPAAMPNAPMAKAAAPGAEAPSIARRQQMNEGADADGKDVGMRSETAKRTDALRSLDEFSVAAPITSPEAMKLESATKQPMPASTESNTVGGAAAAPPPMKNDSAAFGALSEAEPQPAEAAAPPMNGEIDLREDTSAKAKEARPMLEKKLAMTSPRKIGERQFTMRNGVWYEEGYSGEVAVAVTRGSATAKELLAQYADLKEVFALKDPVVLKIGGRWYKFGAEPVVATIESGDKP